MTPQPLTDDERKRIHLYFLDSRLRYGLIVLVLGLVLVELRLGQLLLLAGLAWLGIVLALAMKRPSEEELDQLLSRDLGSLIETATSALDLPEDEVQAPPLALLSPSPLCPVRPRSGRDGRPRSPLNRAVVLLPMEDQLGIYSCDQNAITGQISNVSTEEHHYRDIVSLRKEENVASGAEPTRRAVFIQRLSLELTNGRTIAVPVEAIWQPGSGVGVLGPTELEKTLAAIRALLRDQR